MDGTGLANMMAVALPKRHISVLLYVLCDGHRRRHRRMGMAFRSVGGSGGVRSTSSHVKPPHTQRMAPPFDRYHLPCLMPPIDRPELLQDHGCVGLAHHRLAVVVRVECGDLTGVALVTRWENMSASCWCAVIH